MFLFILPIKYLGHTMFPNKPFCMILIIRDELTCPPTWFPSFRDLTLYTSIFIKAEIVIESEKVDIYYRWIKARGGMDFVEDFVRPGSERGVRLDIRNRLPNTIVTDRIVPENTHRLIGCIRSRSI
jgi:hypothetical protein